MRSQKVIDISVDGVADELSNFSPFEFFIDGVACASMEGFLQALKFDDVTKQRDVCSLVGIKAKRKGRNRNRRWKPKQTLWWNGDKFSRDSIEFQDLLDRAFDALSTNCDFVEALLRTGDAILVHSIGKSNIADTVLTEQEFVSRLMILRNQLLFERFGV